MVNGVDPVVKKQEKLEALKRKLAELQREIAESVPIPEATPAATE